MPKVKFSKSFKFSPNGYDIVEYMPGEQEVSDRCAHVAAEAGVLDKNFKHSEAAAGEEAQEDKPKSKK